jgi:hypothetical protein
MRQINIFELLGDLDEAVRQELHKATQSEDTTECNEPCDSDCHFESNELSTPIEDLITQQINKHKKAGTFPTQDEATAMAILDQINRSYQS